MPFTDEFQTDVPPHSRRPKIGKVNSVKSFVFEFSFLIWRTDYETLVWELLFSKFYSLFSANSGGWQFLQRTCMMFLWTFEKTRLNIAGQCTPVNLDQACALPIKTFHWQNWLEQPRVFCPQWTARACSSVPPLQHHLQNGSERTEFRWLQRNRTGGANKCQGISLPHQLVAQDFSEVPEF